MTGIQGDLFSGAPSMAPEERKRLSSQSRKILAMFQEGPVTTAQLAGVAKQYNARVYELRRAGYKIKMVRRNTQTGVNVFTLED